MAKKSMNMISLMNYAWDQRQKVSAETYQEQCRNLLSHAYVDLNNLYVAFSSPSLKSKILFKEDNN